MKELKTITEKLSFIQRTLSVKKSQKNNFGNYNYRTAEDIYTSFKEIVNKYELGVSLITNFSIQNIEYNLEEQSKEGQRKINNRIFLKCEAILKDNESDIKATSFAELGLDKKGMDIAQLTGAAQTYARKYALQSLLAIDDKEMDLDSQEIKEKEQKALEQEKNNLINQVKELINEDLIGADGEIITKEKILKAKKVKNLNEISINNLKHVITTLAEYKVKQQNNQENEDI